MLDNTDNRKISIKIYVIIVVIYHLFINYCISERNIQHSCLDLCKKKIQYKSNPNKILPTTMLTYLVDHSSSVTYIHMETISDVKCKLRYLHLEEYFIKQKKGKQLPTFMLAFLFLYLS